MSSADNGTPPATTPPGPVGRRGFGTKIGFIMAAAGSAVGLGNLVRFPSAAEEHGGGAFVLIYLGAVLLVGMPLMYSELVIGRRGRGGALTAIKGVSQGKPAGTAMGYAAGLMAVCACVMMLSFYSIIAGWGLHYLAGSIGIVEGFSPQTPEVAEGEPLPPTEFDRLTGNSDKGVSGDPQRQATLHTIFMCLTVGVVIFGVQRGIERVCNLMMPLLILFMLGLLVFVATQGWLGESLKMIFIPNWSEVTWGTVLAALGQAFFSLSLGMGTMILYGSYMQNDRHIIRDGFSVVGLDTLIAMLGGIIVFAVIAAFNKEPSPGLFGALFETIPDLFAQMEGGQTLLIIFFVLVLFAAWSSSISLLEVPVAFLIDNVGLKRWMACAVAGVVIWSLGLASAYNMGTLDQLDKVVSNIMFPAGGLLVALVAGWVMRPVDREAGFAEVGPLAGIMNFCWLFLIRFVTPVMVVIVMVMGLKEWFFPDL